MRQCARSNVLTGLRAVWKSELLLPLLMFLIGSCIFFRADRVPGDLRDSRFNMYVLEHGYRWVTHLDDSFWSASFFYPVRNVITYSDNHLGSLPFYSVFRILGASRETAFQLWVVTIFALNYFVSYYVLRKQNIEQIGATFGAYLFTFPAIIADQMPHIQLAPRFMVPVAFWMASLFLESGSIRSLILLLTACAYQIYLGIYNGYFLILSLAPFVVVLFLYRKQWIAVGSFVANHGVRQLLLRIIRYCLACVGFVLVLLPLILPYYTTQSELGGREWDEVVPMLPRWQSYLYAPPESFLWGKLFRFGDSLPMAWEHRLFLGLIPCAGLVIFLYLWFKKKLKRLDREQGVAMLGVIIGIIVLTLYCQRVSLYYYVWEHLPGAGSIRAVSRIILVLIYPVAFVCGVSIAYLEETKAITGRSRVTGSLAITSLALLVIDQAARVPSVSTQQCKTRLTELEERIRVARRQSNQSVLWVCDRDCEPEIRQLDAMLAAQDLGLKTINGYSGWFPNDYPDALFMMEGDMSADIATWARLHPGAITNQNLLQIGPACKPVSNEPLPTLVNGFGGFERGETIHAWAINRAAELLVPGLPGNEPKLFSFDLFTLKARRVKISAPDGMVQSVYVVPGEHRHVEIPMSSWKSNQVIRFETDTEGVQPNGGDPRTLFFEISDLHIWTIMSGPILPQSQ